MADCEAPPRSLLPLLPAEKFWCSYYSNWLLFNSGIGHYQKSSVKHTHNIEAQSIYLFAKVGTFESDHAHVNRVGDKGLVVHQLI